MILVSGILFLANNAAAGKYRGPGDITHLFPVAGSMNLKLAGEISSNLSEEPIKFKYFSVE
jgi:hypothetical protein